MYQHDRRLPAVLELYTVISKPAVLAYGRQDFWGWSNSGKHRENCWDIVSVPRHYSYFAVFELLILRMWRISNSMGYIFNWIVRLHILIYILKFYNEGCAACSSGYMAPNGVYECMDPFISKSDTCSFGVYVASRNYWWPIKNNHFFQASDAANRSVYPLFNITTN